MRLRVHRCSRRWKKRLLSPLIRCTVNGDDVTARCYEADTRDGWARCFRHNAEGTPFIMPGTDRIAREELRGRVRVWWSRP
jgi:hypothetical protein